jgi:hypothetical protein
MSMMTFPSEGAQIDKREGGKNKYKTTKTTKKSSGAKRLTDEDSN